MKLGLARQATVPGARRPAGGEEGGRRGGGARPRGAEARAGDLGAPRRQRSGRAGRRRDWGARKEGKVAGAAGAEEGVGDGGRSRRAARAARRWSAPLARLGSARSVLGRTAVPSSAPPLIDWPACAATLDKLGPAGGTQGEGAGGGGAGGRREHAGPGREKTWKQGWIRSGQIHFLGGRTGRAALPRATRPAGLLPPPCLPGGGEPARRPHRREQANFSGVQSPSPRGPRGWGLVPKPTFESPRPSVRGHLTRCPRAKAGWRPPA